MKENLKVFYKSYKKFLEKPVIFSNAIFLFFLLTFPLTIKCNKLVDRIDNLEEQIKVIEVQKNEANN